MAPPKKGERVIYFVDGLPGGPAMMGEILEVLGSGWSLKLRLRNGVEVVAADYAPHQRVVDGVRPAGSWDFIV